MRNVATDCLTVLSLGWGVQSWTIAAKIALDELPPIDFMLHSDTSWEHDETYWFARKWTPWLGEHGQNVETVHSSRRDVVLKWKGETESVMAPVFTLAPDGSRGQLKRQCTTDWKIRPIRRFVTDELRRRGIPKARGSVISMMGISLDEFERMKDSDVDYIENVYPLIDLRMTRDDCKDWLRDNDLPIPPKSACVFCPYQNKSRWVDLARKGGADWDVAVAVDNAVRDRRNNFKLYIHPSRRPLDEAVSEDAPVEDWPEATCDSGHCFV